MKGPDMAALTGLGLGADGLERQVHSGLLLVVSDPMIDDEDLVLRVPGALALALSPHRVNGVADLVTQIERLCRRHNQSASQLAFMVGGNTQGFWIGKDWVSAATLPRYKRSLAALAGCLSRPGGRVGIYCHENGPLPGLLTGLSQLLGIPVTGTLGLRLPHRPVGPKGRRPGGHRFVTTAVRFEGDEDMESLTYW